MNSKSTRKRAPRPPRPPIAPSTTPPTAVELWYLGCFRTLRDHLKRSPTIIEFANYVDRSTFPAYTAMRSLERKGLVSRDASQRNRFIVTAAGEAA